MRADGLLLPIASIQNNTWRSLALKRTNGGTRLSAAAKSLMHDGWRLIPAKGTPRTFSLTKASSARFECSSADVYETTLTAPKRLSGADTAKSLGLAARGNVPGEPVTDVSSATDRKSRRTQELIASTVQALETERIDALRSGASVIEYGALRRFTADDRARRLRFLRLVGHTLNNTDWHYFEVVKDYPEMRLSFFAGGWIATGGTGSHLIDVEAGFGSPSSDHEVEPAEVLGVIPGRYDAGATWVMSRRTNIDLTYTMYLVGQDAN